MGNKIANAALILKMLRDAGYKSTSYALAELVDNSIEAKANEIGIYLIEANVIRQRTMKLTQEIAVFDNGEGMSKDVLEKCLSFGWGTRLEGATGLGKFGFGLKGASISQARRIEIYSWKDPNEIYKTHLDYDEVREMGLDELPEPVRTKIPVEYTKIISNQVIPQSGTLVIWKNIDRLNPKTSQSIIQHLNKYMCRIFRHFIDHDDSYGNHVDIQVKVISPEGTISYDEMLKANDPLYLASTNNIPGYENQATNEINEDFKLPVIDTDGVERNIHIISTVAKPAIQLLGGNSAVGKHYEANSGISFVRAGRELELDIKGFFANSEPRHRWHGIEIRFDPQLDEYFGVPNNKQGVRGFKNFDSNEISNLLEEYEMSSGTEKNIAKMKLELHKAIVRIVKVNEAVVKARGAGRRNPKDPSLITTAGLVSQALEKIDPKVVTTSSEVAKTKSNDEKLKEIIEIKMDTDASLTYQDALAIAKIELGNSIQIEESEWPGSTFLDVEFKGNAAVASINRKHPFFSEFYDILRQSKDQKGFEALKIFLMAFTRTEDLLQVEMGSEKFEKIRDKWGDYMKQLAELSG